MIRWPEPRRNQLADGAVEAESGDVQRIIFRKLCNVAEIGDTRPLLSTRATPWPSAALAASCEQPNGTYLRTNKARSFRSFSNNPLSPKRLEQNGSHFASRTSKSHAKITSPAGTRTRVFRVRAEYPDQLDYRGWVYGNGDENRY